MVAVAVTAVAEVGRLPTTMQEGEEEDPCAPPGIEGGCILIIFFVAADVGRTFLDDAETGFVSFIVVIFIVVIVDVAVAVFIFAVWPPPERMESPSLRRRRRRRSVQLLLR